MKLRESEGICCFLLASYRENFLENREPVRSNAILRLQTSFNFIILSTMTFLTFLHFFKKHSIQRKERLPFS